ncbi:MAG: hypothetical protein HOP09_13520 [Hyphomicrobium sp.]|nr:hypothetical protein [Hyphomicrobium sp.]
MMRTLARVLAGFVLACIAAGLTQVLFVITPAKLLSSPAGLFAERALGTGILALRAATHVAIFSAAFALISAGIGEWMRIRSIGYYLFAGLAIGVLGFVAQYTSEVAGQPSIFNNYAVQAYMTSGFFAGLVYWMAAGRSAGGAASDRAASDSSDEDGTSGVPPPARTWKTRPRIIVEDYPKPGTAAGKKATLAERLAGSEDGSDVVVVAARPSEPAKVTSSAAPAPQAKPAQPVAAPQAAPVQVQTSEAQTSQTPAAQASSQSKPAQAAPATTTSVPSTKPNPGAQATANNAPKKS